VPVDVLLLPSPLIPATSYGTLVEALTDRGCETEVADASEARSGPQLIERWAAAADSGARLLAHSNAGYLAPAVRAASGSSRPILFMDAALPPVAGSTRLAPPQLRAHLASMVEDSTGTLPPWTRWWPEETMSAVIPKHLFDAIDAACPRLPLSYFDAEVPAPAGWPDTRHGYLAFGNTYAEEIVFARGQGWTVVELDGGHLAFLVDPAAVADVVVRMLGDTD
jgi:hypothetical protein